MGREVRKNGGMEDDVNSDDIRCPVIVCGLWRSIWFGHVPFSVDCSYIGVKSIMNVFVHVGTRKHN